MAQRDERGSGSRGVWTLTVALRQLGVPFRRDGDRVDFEVDGVNALIRLRVTGFDRLVRVQAEAPQLGRVPLKRMTEAILLTNLLNATRVPAGALLVKPSDRTVEFEWTYPSGADASLELSLIVRAVASLDIAFLALVDVIWDGCRAATAASRISEEEWRNVGIDVIEGQPSEHGNAMARGVMPSGSTALIEDGQVSWRQETLV